MFIVQAAASIFLLSLVLALLVVLFPVFGLVHHPRASLGAYIVTAAMSVTLISIHVGAPLLNGLPGMSWPGTVIDYFLAMAHRMNGAPYPFLWSPPWEYQIGGLTWLIALCGILMTATAISARDETRAKAPLFIASGLLVTAFFVAGAVYSAIQTWQGVAV